MSLTTRLIDGTFDFADIIPKLKQKGLSDEQISSNWGLANEIQQNIISKKLKPVIRTVYLRTAFQLTSSNQVRVSLDTELQFIKELPPENPDTEWMYMGKFPNKSILTFPLGVLEIKLHDTPPEWVVDLVKSGYLVNAEDIIHSLTSKIRAENFSKFQHSMGVLYADKVSVEPDWFDNPIVRVNATGAHGWFDIGVPFTNAQTHEHLSM